MSNIHTRFSLSQIRNAAVSVLLLCGLELAAVWFDGFSWSSLLIMSLLCLLCVVLCLAPCRIPLPAAVLLILALPSVSFLLIESYTHIVWETMEADAVALNLIFYYLLFLFLCLILGRVRLALRTELLFVMIVGIANYFVILFRSTPILPWDLLSLGTAATVADNYEFSISHQFAEITGGFILLFTCCGRLPALCISEITRRLPHKWFGIVLRTVLVLLLMIPTGCYISFLFQPDIADRTSLDDTLFTPKYMYRTNGFFVAFFMDLRFLRIDAPDGYSAEAAQAILAEQETDLSVPDELPNVIVIMNEAFSDPSVLGDFETNTDYMPNVCALMDGAENTVSGYLYSSVLGGNTANSEYEFLTGNTMAFLPSGSVPYQQYIHSDVVSIVDQFKELGYETIAMHPYNASGWNRNKVYPWMHFDRSLFLPDFVDKVKLRKYVDDASDYANILRVCEESDQPVFVFNVTMQNHSGYGTEYDNFKPGVTAELTRAKTNVYLNNYLSLIKISDEAIGNLLKTFEDSERPTIVVFFGDHQPNDYVISPIYKENGLDINNQTLEQQQKRQIVPFFIWANYDIEEASGISVSINYLSSLLFRTAGLPMSSYQSFLYQLYQEIPVLNAVGYIDSDSVCHYLRDADGEQKAWIDQYRILQYYYMFE